MSGSAKRIKDLQTTFDSPDKYGKGLDWAGYTVHDAANVLRRYLNCLPEPIIPLDFYNRFRDPLTVPTQKFDHDEAIRIYQNLISELPPLNRQLLLYILDLLAVFASKADQNRMTAENLAAIFQPGLISHPSHEMAPQAYKLSQDVLVFLINNQDHFLLGMRGRDEVDPAAEMANLTTPVTPTSLRHSKAVVDKTPSNASAGADDVRKYGGLRRNASVSSRKSGSGGGSGGGAGGGGTGGGQAAKSGGVSRSNTLPSRRSPHSRPVASFRPTDGSVSPKPTDSIGIAGPVTAAGRHARSPSPGRMREEVSPAETQNQGSLGFLSPKEPRSRQVSGQRSRQVSGQLSRQGSPVTTPTKERGFPSLFALSPDHDRTRGKLKKKKKPSFPEDKSPSEESSTTSLPLAAPVAPVAPVASPRALEQPAEIVSAAPQRESRSQPTQQQQQQQQPPSAPAPNSSQGFSSATSTSTLMPTMSPTPSATSSVTSQDSNVSGSDVTNASASPDKKKRSRWRWSASKVDQWNPGSPTFGGSNASIAERMRRTSRSPDRNDRTDRKVSSDLSGDDGSNKGGRLGWLKKRAGKRTEQDDRDIPMHVQVQTLPPPQYPHPASPQVQPPTPSSLGKPTSPIAEAENEFDEARPSGPIWPSNSDQQTAAQPTGDVDIHRPTAETGRTSSSTPKLLAASPGGSPGTSPDSDITPKATTEHSPHTDCVTPLPSDQILPPPVTAQQPNGDGVSATADNSAPMR